MSTKTINLSIDSQLENSRLVGFAIRGLSQLLPLEAEAASQLELAVVEAVNHMITHAYGNQTGSELSLDFSLDETQLEIQIYDTGEPLEPGQLELNEQEPPRADDPLSWSETDAWLAILYQTMDQVNYYSVGGLNTLVLQKRLIVSS